MSRDAALGIGILAGPILWLTNLEAQFALAPWICARNWRLVPFAIATTAAAMIAVSGLISWRQWRQAKGGETPTKESRSRAMAMAGVFLSAGFLIVLLAQSIPQLMMSGCE